MWNSREAWKNPGILKIMCLNSLHRIRFVWINCEYFCKYCRQSPTVSEKKNFSIFGEVIYSVSGTIHAKEIVGIFSTFILYIHIWNCCLQNIFDFLSNYKAQNLNKMF